MKEFTSYGVACFRTNKKTGKNEIVLIQRPRSYAFDDFIDGAYNFSKHQETENMFREMTTQELHTIATMDSDFDHLWERARRTVPAADDRMYLRYSTSKRKFETTRPRRLAIIDKLSKEGVVYKTPLWEIPKGRKSPGERPIDAACREFSEETRIKESSIFVFPPEHSRRFVNTDKNVRYVYVYFLAKVLDDSVPSINYSNQEQMREVSATLWMDKDLALKITRGHRHGTVMRKIFKSMFEVYEKLQKRPQQENSATSL